MKKKVLVTGAAGFIGRYVVQELVKNDYEVIALMHEAGHHLRQEVTWIKTDIADADMMRQTAEQIKNCNILIHLAAAIDLKGNDHTILTNSLGTYHVVQLAALLSAECFIFLSSIPVIGTPKQMPIDEEHPADPDTLYHITKYTGEMIVKTVGPASMRKIILRIPSPIGVGMSSHNYLSFLLSKCRCSDTIEVYGEGKRRQNYIDVRDIAAAVLCAVVSKEQGLFLIAGEKEITNRELAFLCKELTHSSSEIIWGKRKDPEERNQWVISGRKAFEYLHFSPKYRLEDTIQWILKKEKRGS